VAGLALGILTQDFDDLISEKDIRQVKLWCLFVSVVLDMFRLQTFLVSISYFHLTKYFLFFRGE